MIEDIGHIFQIYGKIIPVCGKCLRLEEHITLKEDIPLEQGIEDATINRSLEILRAFELNREKKYWINSCDLLQRMHPTDLKDPRSKLNI